jgi:D-3-phosphoglycerate dehydrogenase
MRIPMDREAENCVREIIRDVDAILFRAGEVTGPIIKAADKLRIIAVHGVGTDYVDVETATARRVHVTITPGANTVAVAEFVLSVLLMAIRRLDRSMAAFQTGGWDAGRIAGEEIHGKVLGIVGFGAVGYRVASLAEAFGMKIVVAEYKSLGSCRYPRAPLAELAPVVDALVVAVPRRPSTVGMISGTVLRSMKPTAGIVNASRGEVVDQDALEKALDDEVLAFAALDVFDSEPTPIDHPLVKHPRVLATPHMAGSTRETLQRTAQIAGSEIRRVLADLPPLHAINPFGQGNDRD